MAGVLRPILRPVRPLRPLTRAITEAGVGGGARVVDLFVIVGQSNADGRGDSSLSPAAPHGLYISGTTITDPLADPVGSADTGSMWPAFSNEWFAQTGRRSAFVEQATGSSGLLPDANGGAWSPAGAMRSAAVAAANDAVTAINGSAYELGDIYFVWVQGETDATFINGTTVTGPLYEQALEDLADYFKAQVPAMAKMCVVQTGSGKQVAAEWDTTQVNFNAIRLAQRDAIGDNSNLLMAYPGTYSFTVRGLMSDNLHYSQAGLNLSGACAARQVVSPDSPPAIASPFISASAYADADLTATLSRTASHTTPTGTTCLIVATSAQRNASAVAGVATSVTFNGVAMKECSRASNTLATPAGACAAQIWIIDDDLYGASLSGVTANIIVTSGSTRNLISWCAINAKEVARLDWAVGSGSTGTVNSISANIDSNGPCLVVSCVSSLADSASAITSAFTGQTEAMDAGLSSGTRSAQIAVGYSVESSELTAKAVSAAFSAACTNAAVTVAAFRPKVAGE